MGEELLAADRALRSIIFFAFCLISLTTCCQLCRTPANNTSRRRRRRRGPRIEEIEYEEDAQRPSFAVDDRYRGTKVDVSTVSQDKKATLLKPSAPPAGETQ